MNVDELLQCGQLQQKIKTKILHAMKQKMPMSRKEASVTRMADKKGAIYHSLFQKQWLITWQQLSSRQA